ncbi:MAG: hypothetical protein IKG66_00785 [Lachnospiraceae bacterium]|nr:hypothetical protein [Lachnospiraceae bacterium]
MIKIKFLDRDVFYPVSFSQDSAHVCTTIGEGIPQDTCGFQTFRMNGQPLGDRSDFTTIYRILDNGIQWSNDGSVWVDPPQPEPVPDPEPVAPQPTQLDRVEAQALYTALMTDTLLEDEEVEA